LPGIFYNPCNVLQGLYIFIYFFRKMKLVVIMFIVSVN
jgi:hypothetical protein